MASADTAPETMGDWDEYNDDAVEDEGGPEVTTPKAKRRKPSRKQQSCVACRRLKTRCDRQVPCGQCTKRGWEHWCPDRAPEKVKDLYRTAEQFEFLEQRVRELEAQLGGASGSPSKAVSVPGPSPDEPRDLESFLKKHSAIIPPSPRPTETIRRGSSLAPVVENPLQNSGTLIVTKSGRSRFMGRSAASEWLLDSQKDLESRSSSRPTSPHGQTFSALSIPGCALPEAGTSLLSQSSSLKDTYLSAIAMLPDVDEAEVQTQSYFQNLIQTGTSTPLHPDIFDEFSHRILDIKAAITRGETVSFLENEGQLRAEFHKLALVFAVIALGMLVNLQLPPNDSRSRRYCDLAVECLVAGRYLICSTLTCLQALSCVARYLTHSDMKNGSEMAYHIRGTAMRLLFSMGLHRDGSRWKLTDKDLNVRRRVFWDIYSADVFSSKDWDRPNGLSPRHFDTKFPDEFYGEGGEYSLLRCQLVCLAKSVLDESLEMDPPPYSHISEIWASIREFEEAIPIHLRSRSALTAQVSQYPVPGAAAAVSHAPSRKNPALAFQQYSLTLASSLCVFTLLRPYFVQAISSYPSDPLQSPYADAFLAVAERCSMMVNMLQELYSLFPVSCTRQSPFWSHTFSAAACLSTLIVLCPHTPLAPFAQGYVEATIRLFQKVEPIATQPSVGENLAWLQRVHKRALQRMPIRPDPSTPLAQGPTTLTEEDAEQLSLVGWRTKLVEQSATNRTTLDDRRTGFNLPMAESQERTPTLPDYTVSNSEAQAFNLAEDLPLEGMFDLNSGSDMFINWLDACEPDLLRQFVA